MEQGSGVGEGHSREGERLRPTAAARKILSVPAPQTRLCSAWFWNVEDKHLARVPCMALRM